MCSHGGKRETGMGHSCTENSFLVATRVHPKPCITLWRPCGPLDQTHPSRPRRSREGARASLRHLHRWKTSRHSGPAFLFVCQPEKLDQRQQAELALIRQASPSAETTYGLAQAFLHMMREQTGQQLDTWLGEAAASHLPELESIARGIQQDKAAVLAGLTVPWSTGPVEGHVNRRQHPEKEHVWPRQAATAREHGCCMCPRRSLLAQLCWLDRNAPDVARRADGEQRNHPRRSEARRTMRMSFDINETVFDAEGTYLEEKAVRYEHALMDQFASSRSVTCDHPERNRTRLGRGHDPLCHHLPWRDPTNDDHGRSGGSRVFPLPTQSHHREGGWGGDHPSITCLLVLSPACLPIAASQPDAGTLDTTGRPTPGARVAGAGQLMYGQVLCPDGKGGRL
jgi:hypothetical protein